MSFSIVIETENLASGGVEDLARCLDSLGAQSCDVTTAEEVWIVVGGCLDKGAADEISWKYPWVQIHRVDGALSYLGAKKLGAEISTGEIVVYADSDVAYSPRWLEETLLAFERNPDATVVFSDTRIAIGTPYELAMQLTWIFGVHRPGHVAPAAKFRLNNFAIRREAMLASYFDDALPLYRNAIEFWRQRLRVEGAVFHRIPAVMGRHLPPRGFAEWWHRMLVFGADPVATANYRQLADGRVIEDRSFARRLVYAVRGIVVRSAAACRRLAVLLSEDRVYLRYLPVGLPIALVALSIQALGMLVAVVSPRIIFDRIVAFEDGNARLQASGAMLGRFRSITTALPRSSPAEPPGA